MGQRTKFSNMGAQLNSCNVASAPPHRELWSRNGSIDLFPLEKKGSTFCIPSNQTLALGYLQKLGHNLLTFLGKVAPVR